MSDYRHLVTMMKEKLNHQHIMVIGDVMIDRYVTGRAERISPEAPVPVLNWRGEKIVLGGAANVVGNLRSLQCKVSLISVCGKDTEADELENLLAQLELSNLALIREEKRFTTVKTRFISDFQQMIRLDKEHTHWIQSDTEQNIISHTKKILSSQTIDGVILQDYNKGLLSKKLIAELLNLFALYKVKVYVDPKGLNFFEFRDIFLFKPNLKEISQALQTVESTDENHLFEISKDLTGRIQCQKLMITCGARGIWIYQEGSGNLYPTSPRLVKDVSGAGDTVISLAAASYAVGCNDDEVALICNIGGGLVCEQPGVVAINREEIWHELSHHSH